LEQEVFELLEEMDEQLQEAQPDAESFGWPEPADADEYDEPLYDSTRSYLDQLACYRRHEGKTDDGKLKKRSRL